MENEEKSLGELSTFGRTEESRHEKELSDGDVAWDSAVSIGELETLKPPEEIRDDGRTNAPRRWKAGETILGRYVVERELGEGGMGVVYECLDTVGGVKVAVKSLPPEVGRDQAEMEEVRENFQLVCGLRHPNIAGVRTLEKDARGEYFLVMDVAEGVSLRTWMRRKRKAGGVALEDALPILKQVASALDYAHRMRVIHRDVKPGNVMVDAKGEAKVLDFGLAAQIRSSMSRVSRDVGRTSGTRPYMAPEQWEGRPQDARTDQYALGVTAYEMLAGRLPFEGDDTEVLRSAVLNGCVRNIEDVPPAPMAAIRRALAKKPKDRFATCGDFVATLAGAPERRNARGNTLMGWMMALVLAGMLVAVGAWWWRENGKHQAERVKVARMTENVHLESECQATEKAGAEQALAEKMEAERKAAEKALLVEEERKAEEAQKAEAEEIARQIAVDARKKNVQQNLDATRETANSSVVVAVVNGSAITENDVQDRFERFVAQMGNKMSTEQLDASRHEIRVNILNELIMQQIMRAAVVAADIELSDKEYQQDLKELAESLPDGITLDEYLEANGVSVDELREQMKIHRLILRQIETVKEPSEKELRAFFDENRDSFAQPETVTASHILIAFNDGDDEAAKAAKRKRLVGIRQQILNGADFAKMAAANSDCPSRENGGDLGTFGRGAMVPAFEDAAFSQKVGQVGDIVETIFGYHLEQI